MGPSVKRPFPARASEDHSIRTRIETGNMRDTFCGTETMASEDHSIRTRIETLSIGVQSLPQKIIPLEQLKPTGYNRPQKIIPLEQGLKLLTGTPCRFSNEDLRRSFH